MTILLDGKPINAKPAVQRVGKHRQLTMEQIKKRHPADPFPPVDEFRKDSVEHRLSVASDLKLWVEQRMGELATAVDEHNWLIRQVEDSRFVDHPDRPEAIERCMRLADEIEELASDIAFLEAHADRIWQSLDPEHRESMAMAWVADVNDERIILNSWTRIAQVGFRWPVNYGVSRKWFACLARPLIDDMNERGLKAGIPLGEQRDPWEDKDDKAKEQLK